MYPAISALLTIMFRMFCNSSDIDNNGMLYNYDIFCKELLYGGLIDEKVSIYDLQWIILNDIKKIAKKGKLAIFQGYASNGSSIFNIFKENPIDVYQRHYTLYVSMIDDFVICNDPVLIQFHFLGYPKMDINEYNDIEIYKGISPQYHLEIFTSAGYTITGSISSSNFIVKKWGSMSNRYIRMLNDYHKIFNKL